MARAPDSRVAGPIPASYWLIHRLLLAGEYPGADQHQTARQRLTKFLDAGIRTFIDLTEAGEGPPPYDALLQRLAGERGLEVKHVRHPVEDMGLPRERDHMTRILAAIREEIDAGTPVYVHCWGGIGRTGTVIGCWLVEEGLAGPEALERIAELRRGTGARSIRSPETDEQCRYVCEWLETESR